LNTKVGRTSFSNTQIIPSSILRPGLKCFTRRLADISRAKKLLGFKPSISLEEGLRGLVEWWRKRRDIPDEETKFHEDGKNLEESGKPIPLLRT
jgi:hypothetical protein